MKLKLVLASLALVLAALAAYFLQSDARERPDAVRRAEARAAPAAPAALRAGEDVTAEETARRAEAAPAPELQADAPLVDDADSHSLRVHVVDPDGEPLEGVSVVACTGWLQFPSVRRRAESDSGGWAAFPLADLQRAVKGVVAFAAEGAFDPDHAVHVDLQASLPEHVTLTVALGGVLEVEVQDGAGAVVLGAHVAAVVRASSDMTPGRALRQPGPQAATASAVDGVSRLDALQAGIEVVVMAREAGGSQRVERVVRVPARGERTRVTLAFPEDDVVLIGRVDRPDTGSHRAGWSVSVLDRGGRQLWDIFELKPEGADGRDFRLRLSAERAGRLSPDSWLVFQHGDQPCAFESLAGRLTPGVHDLGNVRSIDGEVLFAGRARFEDERPWAEGRLSVEVRAAIDGEWSRLPRSGVETGPDGRFTVPGRGEPLLAWRLVPARGTAQLVAPETLTPGATDIDLVLRAIERPMVEGRLLVDESPDAGKLLKRLTVHVEALDNPRMDSSAQVQADGTFRFSHLPSDGFDVSVRTNVHEQPLERVERVGTPENPWPEPRLEIDLRGRLALATLSGVGAGGEPVPFLVRPRGAPPHSVHTGWPLNPVGLVLCDPPQDLIASAAGYRDVLLTAVSGDRTVRFEAPALALSLHWPGVPPLKANQRLRPVLVPVGDVRDPPGEHVDFHEGAAFDVEGRIRLSVPAPGRYAVLLQLEVVHESGRSANIHAPPIHPQIEVPDDASAPVFEVHWTPADVLSRFEPLMR